MRAKPKSARPPVGTRLRAAPAHARAICEAVERITQRPTRTPKEKAMNKPKVQRRGQLVVEVEQLRAALERAQHQITLLTQRRAPETECILSHQERHAIYNAIAYIRDHSTSGLPPDPTMRKYLNQLYTRTEPNAQKANERREYHANGTYWSGVPTVDMPCDYCSRPIMDHDPRTHACPPSNGDEQA